MSILSAGTSNTTSLIYTGDTTGAMVFQTNGTTEAMRITAAQNVGIGTSNPTGKINVQSEYSSDTTTQIRMSDTTGTSLDFVGTAGGVKWINARDTGSGSAYPLTFQTGGTERMRIDTSGRVTKPYQPFFYARKTTGGTISAGTVVEFNGVTTNIGSHYNSSTYRFTAPIAGVYSFTAKVWMSKNGGSYADFSPRVNGTLIPNSAGAYYDGAINSTGLANYIVNFQYSLNASDYVDFVVGGNASPYLDNSGYFCGFLVS